MGLERKDRVKDTTTTIGTGTISLSGSAPVGFRSFASAVTSLATVRYFIASSDLSEWELGEGIFTDATPDTLTRVTIYTSSNAGSLVNFSAGTKNVSMVLTAKDMSTLADNIAPQNLLKNGNFINNSTNGYGSTPDDWTSSNANPVQGGIPALTKQNLIDGLGIADGDIEGLWNLNGNFTDLSANGYNLTAGAGGAAPTDTSDGLMAQAKVFAGASSQYAVSSSATNLRITGSKTLIGFVKPTNVTDANKVHFGLTDSGDTTYFRVRCSTAKLYADCSGLTGQGYACDVDLQAGKWYMVVLRYNATANTLDIIINGIKKTVAVTGTPTVTNQEFAVGRNGANAGAYASSTIQNAIIFSVALTDNQVKKLFAMTMYKGQKIRRATTNAIQYQDLPMDLVEKLRGRTVALRSDMYQDTASTGQISILQTLASGSTDETIISATDATTGSWLEKVATGTISATAVGIRIQLKHSTSDGNVWFKNVSLYEGSTLLPYDYSKEDWSRFPLLLKMDVPTVLNGYSFEETPRLRSMAIAASRDMTAASGDVAYTGVGFVPTSIICFYGAEGNGYGGIGFADSAKNKFSRRNDNAVAFAFNPNLITMSSAAAGFQEAIVKTYDADGFTLTWTKTATPTGTLLMRFLCFR